MREDIFDEIEFYKSEDSAIFLAYIKAIDLDQALALGARIPSDVELQPGVQLYSLHASDGSTIGVTDNWAAAYNAAIQNNLVPVSVH